LMRIVLLLTKDDFHWIYPITILPDPNPIACNFFDVMRDQPILIVLAMSDIFEIAKQ